MIHEMFDPTLVHEYLKRSAGTFPDKEALVCSGKRMTYGEIDADSDRIAGALISLGLRRHDRVVLFLDNSCELVVALYGVLKMGGVFVITNGSMKAAKLRFILRDSGASALITHFEKSRIFREAVKGLANSIPVICVGSGEDIANLSPVRSFLWRDIMRQPEHGVNTDARQENGKDIFQGIDNDLATLIYTSGSTGEPKGVMSSHRNMVSAARSIIQYLGNNKEDRVLNVLPLSFDYGLYQVIMVFMFGGTVVLENNFQYPNLILETIQKEKVTGFPIVPTIAALLLRMQDLRRHDLVSLKYITNTGAALPVEHIRRLRQILPNVRIYSMFGLTECKRVCYLPPEEIDRRPSSVGVPMPNCEVFVVDEKGEEVLPGEVGELVVRGANVTRGYWNAPELTASVFRAGRIPGETLLHTGDLFKRDEEGFLYFLGRKDDQIKTKGERVGPKEVENALCRMEGVSEAAVVGVPDEILGNAIRAYVVKSAGVSISEKDVLKFCSDCLESFMVPKQVIFRTELPKTPNGKVDKKALKEG